MNAIFDQARVLVIASGFVAFATSVCLFVLDRRKP